MPRTAKPWSTADDERLAYKWDAAYPLHKIAADLHRTPSACYQRARVLGLPPVPDGWERLTAAARRTGYHPGQLRYMLRWACVRLRPALVNPACPGKHPKTYIVEAEAVDDALRRWHATEPLWPLAKRLGIPGDHATLRRKLIANGFTPRGQRYHLRVTEAELRAAVANGG